MRRSYPFIPSQKLLTLEKNDDPSGLFSSLSFSNSFSSSRWRLVRFTGVSTASSITNQDYEDVDSLDPYTLVNLGTTWQMSDAVQFGAGVTNLFDETVLRTDTGTGAATFNEPGRAFYMSLTSTF